MLATQPSTDAEVEKKKEDESPADLVASMLTKGVMLSPAQREAVLQAMRNQKEGLKVFTAAVANRRVERVMKLLQTLTSVEDELFQQHKRIQAAETPDLIKLFVALSNEVSENVDFIKGMSEGGGGMTEILGALFASILQTKASDATGRLSPQSREKVRSIYERLTAKTPRRNGATAEAEGQVERAG